VNLLGDRLDNGRGKKLAGAAARDGYEFSGACDASNCLF
jgi:hypothetical protein